MLDKLVKEFYNMYPDAPNPEHYPKSFEFYVKMFKFNKGKKSMEQQKGNG